MSNDPVPSVKVASFVNPSPVNLKKGSAIVPNALAVIVKEPEGEGVKPSLS